MEKYNILLLCAAGMSTGLLMSKLKKYAADNNIELNIDAVGLSANDYIDEAKKHDVILMGPQVSYRVNEVKEATKMPVATIPSTDYALGNAKNIFALAAKLLHK